MRLDFSQRTANHTLHRITTRKKGKTGKTDRPYALAVLVLFQHQHHPHHQHHQHHVPTSCFRCRPKDCQVFVARVRSLLAVVYSAHCNCNCLAASKQTDWYGHSLSLSFFFQRRKSTASHVRRKKNISERMPARTMAMN